MEGGPGAGSRAGRPRPGRRCLAGLRSARPRDAAHLGLAVGRLSPGWGGRWGPCRGNGFLRGMGEERPAGLAFGVRVGGMGDERGGRGAQGVGQTVQARDADFSPWWEAQVRVGWLLARVTQRFTPCEATASLVNTLNFAWPLK